MNIQVQKPLGIQLFQYREEENTFIQKKKEFIQNEHKIKIKLYKINKNYLKHK